MRRLLLLVSLFALLLVVGASYASARVDGDGWRLAPAPSSEPLVYGHSWGYYDVFIGKATWLAGRTFGVSPAWLQACNNAEGGDVGRELLRRTLFRPLYRHGDGWNNIGSYAFGPWQMMMDRKPAPHWWDWGTFEHYMVGAFRDAHHRGLHVPVDRFRRPDSYLGQALVTAYMFSIGQSGQWSGAGC